MVFSVCSKQIYVGSALFATEVNVRAHPHSFECLILFYDHKQARVFPDILVVTFMKKCPQHYPRPQPLIFPKVNSGVEG